MMSSGSRHEDSRPSNLLQVPSGDRSMTNGQARAMTRLAKCGKNDSVKSTYSLSVFLDPDASKDMVRHEELWYPMEDPGSQGLDGEVPHSQRTAALSAAAAGATSSEDMLQLLIREKERQLTLASNQMTDYRRQSKEPLRNGNWSTNSSTVMSTSAHKASRSGNESGTDVETHFNRNTVVMGINSGEGGRAAGRGEGEEGGESRGRTEAREGTETRDESGYGVRRWSTEGNLPRASETHDTEDDEDGEEVAEHEEIVQSRSHIGALSKASLPGSGVNASSESAADEDALGYSTRTKERSDFRHGHKASGIAADNGHSSDNRGRQDDARNLKTSTSSTEHEKTMQTRSHIGDLTRASKHGVNGSSDSAADEDAAGPKERSDFRRVHDARDTGTDEARDGYSDDRQTRKILRTTNSSTDEEDSGGYEIATQGRKSFGERIDGASSGSASAADEDVAAARYSSAMQPRTTSFGQLRSRSQSTRFTDDGRSSNVVAYDGSLMRTAQGMNARGDEDLTLTEGSDEEETEGKSYLREPIRTRPKLRRTMPVDGSNDNGQVYQSGSTVVDSAARKNSSVRSERELSPDDHGRRNTLRVGREGIRRAATESEEETGRISTPTPLMYRGAAPNVRGQGQGVSAENHANWNRHGGTMDRRNDPTTSTYTDRRRTQEGSNEGRPEGIQHNVIRESTTPSSSSYTGPGRGRASQQLSSDEDVAKGNARSDPSSQAVPTSRVRDSTFNDARNRPTARRSITSEEDGTVNGSDHHRNRPGQMSNSTRPRDVGQYQPRPAERKKLEAVDSLSSTEYSSPREPYSPNGYLQRATNTRDGRRSTDTDSVSASDDSRTPHHSVSGQYATTRQGNRDNGYRAPYVNSTDVQTRPQAFPNGARALDNRYANSTDVQNRPGTFPNGARAFDDRYDNSTDVQTRQGAFPNGARAFDDRYNNSTDVQTRAGAFPNGARALDDGYSAPHGLTHLGKHVTPSTGHTMTDSEESDVDDWQDTRSQQQLVLDFPSESEDLEGTRHSTHKTSVKRKTTTTPVAGVVRVTPQPSLKEAVRETTTRTTKTTPVFGVVSLPDADPRHTPVVPPPSYRNRTPVVGLISVSRSPSPERRKTPIVGHISVQPPLTQSHVVSSTERTHHRPITGLISVSSSSNQIQRRSTTPSAQLIPDVNNNINAYSGKFRTDLQANTVIETLAVPAPETQTEIVGIDPELRRASKTGSNQYRITMNLRPVVGDASELGYEVYNTAFGRATPISVDRLRTNGSTADWGYPESADESYYRPPSAPIGTPRSRQSSVRTPNTQHGFIPMSNGRRSSSISKLNSAAYSATSYGRNLNPVGIPTYNIPNRSSVGRMDGFRSASSRQGLPLNSRNTLLQVPPIHQTVTSRPRRLSSDANLLPGYNPGFLHDPGRSRQKRLSSTMSSVFLSPTIDRRCNFTPTNGPYSFRDDAYNRQGRFH